MTLPAPLTEFSLSAHSRPVGAYTLHLTAPEIGGRPVEDPYDLDAPYQRGSVWTADQRRALVKSFLMGLPVGNVIVARLPYNIEKFYRVVDGRQRIETMRLFVANEFTVPGWWFSADQLTEGETARHRDVTFSDLNGRGHRSTIGAILPSLEFDVTRKWIPEAREWETVPKDQWVTRAAALATGGES